ncbi:MAG: DUF1549 domain-containing protein, partial [Planctomycetes bacterium]|nr:DUF1549 domain-containing protein [Planctomycetota bacterium]
MRLPATRTCITALLALGLVPPWAARSQGQESAESPRQDQIEFFEKKIRPLLVERCYKCHSIGAEAAKGGLLLDSREGLLKGGDSGPSVVPGDPGKSPLIRAVRYVDAELQMPPKGRLSPEQVADFEAWVSMGAPDPRVRAASPTRPARRIDFSKAREFWSFRALGRPAPPEVSDREWPRRSLDRFILARMEEKGLRPAPDADKRTLIRRATFDLLGLPPTPEEVEVFLRDESPEAFDRVIDRLLASPHYGERWGRHWLDVVRYADTAGDNSDYPVPQASKYRDYVIASFNRDTPYDAFLREQIAGDLLPFRSEEERRDPIVATGFLAV